MAKEEYQEVVVVETFLKTRYKIALMLMGNLALWQFGEVTFWIVILRGRGFQKATLSMLYSDVGYIRQILYSAVEMLPCVAVGRLAEVYWSARWMLFALCLLSSISTCLVPLAADKLRSAIFMDAIFISFNLFYGSIIPITHVLLSRWAPPNERFIMGSLVYSGIPLGNAVATFLTTWMSTNFKWQSIFYGCSVVNFVWLIPWVVVIRDDPSVHLTMTKEENRFVLSSVADELYEYKRRLHSSFPWEAMFRSPAFWAGAILHVTSTYAWTLFEKQFTKQSVDFIVDNDMLPLNQAVICAMPLIWICPLMYLFSLIAFNVIQHDVMKLVDVYRVGIGIALIGTALNIPNYYFQDSLKDCNVMFNSILILFVFGYLSTSMMITLDMAPNYAGTMIGLYYTFGLFPDFFWSKLFKHIPGLTLFESLFAAGTVVFAFLIGLVNLSTDLQPWNDHSRLLDKSYSIDEIDMPALDEASSTFTSTSAYREVFHSY